MSGCAVVTSASAVASALHVGFAGSANCLPTKVCGDSDHLGLVLGADVRLDLMRGLPDDLQDTPNAQVVSE